MSKAIKFKSNIERKRFARVYDLFNSFKSYKKESKFLSKLIKENFGSRKINLLDVGCGTASHIKFMHTKNINITGIDFNPDMITIARKKAPYAKFKVANMLSYKFKSKFEVITALFSVFGYNLSKEDLRKAIQNSYNHLLNKGFLLFDMGFVKDTYPGKFTTTSFDEFRRGTLKLVRIYNSEVHGNVTHFNFSILTEEKGRRDYLYGTDKQSLFSIREITEIIVKAGFKVTVLDSSTFKGFGKNSFSPLFICQK